MAFQKSGHLVRCPTKKNNANKVPRCFSVMWEPKILLSPVRIGILLPQNDQIWPEIGILGHFGPGLAGSFGALSVGWLVVMACGLYLARHLFTLYQSILNDNFDFHPMTSNIGNR